jgi:hypothetical protein
MFSIACESPRMTRGAPAAGNENVDSPDKVRRGRVLELRARGPQCFDLDYYVHSNPDLGSLAQGGQEQLWQHFVNFGQFEDRRFRFSCAADLSWVATEQLWHRDTGF